MLEYELKKRMELHLSMQMMMVVLYLYENWNMDYITPIDYILHSMWSSVDIKLSNNLVSESGTNYMYKALMETLLTYSENTKRIQLANAGFTGESGDFTQTHPDSPLYNHGLKTR